jgi:hypothetical protein
MPSFTTNLIWTALVVSQLIYLVVLNVGILQNEPLDSEFLRAMSLSLGVVCLLEVMIIVFVFRRYVVRTIQARTVDLSTPQGVQRVFLPLVICWILAEAIAVHGLVLARLAGSSAHYMLPFLAVSLSVMWFTRPWAPLLRRAADSAELARSSRPIE